MTEQRLDDTDLDNIEAAALGKARGVGGALAHPTDTLRLVAEVRRLRAALAEVGGLTRWAGWAEMECPRAGTDLRAIQEIVRRETGRQVADYT